MNEGMKEAYIAVCARSNPTTTGACVPYGITQRYLPPGRGSISRPYPGHCCIRYSIHPPVNDERLNRPVKLYQSSSRSVYQLAALYA